MSNNHTFFANAFVARALSLLSSLLLDALPLAGNGGGRRSRCRRRRAHLGPAQPDDVDGGGDGGERSTQRVVASHDVAAIALEKSCGPQLQVKV